MRSVLCYGDSNTYGYVPGGTASDRFGWRERWPGVMARHLGNDWHVVEEGLGGRTTVRNDDVEGHFKNGRTYLKPCVLSHAPLDVVILMLGTNDLKARFNQTAAEIAMGVACLIHDLREYAPGPGAGFPEVLVVAPPPLGRVLPDWEDIFEGAHAKSGILAVKLESMADSMGVHFFDAATVCESDPRDGFHIGAEGHAALGAALAEEVLAIGWPACG